VEEKKHMKRREQTTSTRLEVTDLFFVERRGDTEKNEGRFVFLSSSQTIFSVHFAFHEKRDR
jgi:hypothetical protein